jgi:4'-phosphopantetheinyl transferase
MQIDISWETPPPETQPEGNEIHLWRAFLDCDTGVLQRLEATLAPEERSRAEKFVFAGDRNHFIAARGILRETLGAYVGCRPAALEIAYGSRGKPLLGGARSDDSIAFNLSHTRGLAVYAIARGRPVGVDIEAVRSRFESERIAERFFSPEEIEELRALPEDGRTKGFFQCWTRKEAYIKARGEGLHIPLDSFRVTVRPDEPEKLVSADSSRWKLHSFEPAEGFAGALVGEGKDWQLRYWQWRP